MMAFLNFNLPIKVVFNDWKVGNSAVLIVSCIGVAVMAAAYELLKRFEQMWIDRYVQAQVPQAADQIFVAYFLMLVAMTFNVWLVGSIILGAGAGHLSSGAIHLWTQSHLQNSEADDCTTPLVHSKEKSKNYQSTKNETSTVE